MKNKGILKPYKFWTINLSAETFFSVYIKKYLLALCVLLLGSNLVGQDTWEVVHFRGEIQSDQKQLDVGSHFLEGDTITFSSTSDVMAVVKVEDGTIAKLVQPEMFTMNLADAQSCLGTPCSPTWRDLMFIRSVISTNITRDEETGELKTSEHGISDTTFFTIEEYWQQIEESNKVKAFSIHGKILYWGVPISNYTKADVNIRIYDTNKKRDISVKVNYNKNTGAYSIENIPVGVYTIWARVEAGYPYDTYSGGDFTNGILGLWDKTENVNISQLGTNISLDIPVGQTIHLKKPIDNQQILGNIKTDRILKFYLADKKPSIKLVEWEKVPNAVSYKLRFILIDKSSGDFLDTKEYTLTRTSYSPKLVPTKPNTYYRMDLDAFDRNKKRIAFVSSFYKNGHSSDVSFTVIDDTRSQSTPSTTPKKVKPSAAWGWKRISNSNITDAHNFVSGKGTYSTKKIDVEISPDINAPNDLIAFYQSGSPGNWGWKRVSKANLEDANNFINGSGPYNRKIKQIEIVPVKQGSGTDLIVFYQSGGTQGWGWKRVSSLNYNDALNFLNGAGTYTRQIKNAEIIALQKGSRIDLIIFYQYGQSEVSGKWKQKRFSDTDALKSFLGTTDEAEVVTVNREYIVFYKTNRRVKTRKRIN